MSDKTKPTDAREVAERIAKIFCEQTGIHYEQYIVDKQIDRIVEALEATARRERRLGYKEVYDYVLDLQYSQSPVQILEIVSELRAELEKELNDDKT